jgi:hypothetical protein
MLNDNHDRNATDTADTAQLDPICRIQQTTTSRQATTFDRASGEKVLWVRRGERRVLAAAEGCGVLVRLWMTFPGWFHPHWMPDAEVSTSILKTLILRISWDGCDQPAVAAPVGDFFGNGLCEVRSFTAGRIGMPSGGFACRFPMPFRSGFRIELENLDERIDARVFLNAQYQLLPDLPEDAGWFHAHFGTGRLGATDPVVMAEVAGAGRMAGCTLAMQGRQPGYMAMLEANEQVAVDDEDAPGLLGTGLEDFFDGGWYFRGGAFAGSEHGVVSRDVANASVAMYRIMSQDAIHFRRRLDFRFVNPCAADRLRPFAYSSCTYLYLDRPQGACPAIPPADRLLCWYRMAGCDPLTAL